jgi:hypothetical protein
MEGGEFLHVQRRESALCCSSWDGGERDVSALILCGANFQQRRMLRPFFTGSTSNHSEPSSLPSLSKSTDPTVSIHSDPDELGTGPHVNPTCRRLDGMLAKMDQAITKDGAFDAQVGSSFRLPLASLIPVIDRPPFHAGPSDDAYRDRSCSMI